MTVEDSNVRSPARRKKRPLRKTQTAPSAPSDHPFEVPDASATTAAVFSSSFPDFGSPSMTAFPEDSFGFYSASFPARRPSTKDKGIKASTATSKRGRSHSPPRRAVLSGPTTTRSSIANNNNNDDEPQPQQVSLEDLDKERRRLSLLLGDEQFPADDVSAVLGDFSSSVTDFPGVNLEVARKSITSSIMSKSDKKKKKKKSKSQQPPKAAKSPSTPTSSKKKVAKPKSTTTKKDKDEEQAKQTFQEVNNESQTSLSSQASAATIAALEALEHSARVREKGELAQKLQESRRRHLMQSPPSSSDLRTSNTSNTTSTSDTASTKKSAVVNPPTQLASADSSLDTLDFYLELYTGTSHSNDNPAAADTKRVSSSRSLLSGATKSKKKQQQPSTPKQPRKQSEAPPQIPKTNATTTAISAIATKQHKQQQPKKKPASSHREHADLPSLREFEFQSSMTSITGGAMKDDSEMSLSLSDLQRSERRSGGGSSSKGKTNKGTKSSNDSTATTVNLSKSSMASSSSSFSSSTSTLTTSRSRASSKNKGATGLDQTVHSTPDQASSVMDNNSEQQQQRQPSGNTSSCLLESLALDTVHENSYEDASETASMSRHSTAAGATTVNHSSSLSMPSSPKKNRKQTCSPSSSSSVASLQHSVPEMSASPSSSKNKVKSKVLKRSSKDDQQEDDQRSIMGSRRKSSTSTTTKTTKVKKGTTRRTSEKSASSAIRKSSRGEDVANPRPDRHLTTKTPSPARRQRRKSSMISTDVDKHSLSLNDLPDESRRRGDGMLASGYKHKSDHNLNYSEPVMPDDTPRARREKRKEDRPADPQTYHCDKSPRHCSSDEPIWEDGLYYFDDRYYHKTHDRYGYVNDAELAYFRNVLRRRIDPERFYRIHPGPGGTPFPFSDHGTYYYYHGDYSPAPTPHPTNPTLRRRHSLGSGHSRETVMHEISTAMEQEYKCSTCGHCGHVISRCHCSSHHHNLEPIVDISRSRSRHPREEHEQETCLPPEKGRPVSLFDTFGIKLLNTEFREKRGRLDEEVHSVTLPSPGSVPMYHRPKGYELKQYLQSTRIERFTTKAAGNQQHRGRKIVGGSLSSGSQKPGVRNMTSSQQGEFDDGSLKYPPRASSSVASGHTLDVSYLDDASFPSFAT